MKTMILAAGLGTRLLPHTHHRPKPLFTIDGRPMLDILLDRLEAAGCEEVVINTHHLADQIQQFIAHRQSAMPVVLRHEPEILGTGGAIKNVADRWDQRPFMVINSDVVSDIDLEAVYAFHQSHACPVTLVLVDCPDFNTVRVDSKGRVCGFDGHVRPSGLETEKHLTFTGIQVIAPEILDLIPDGIFYSSIDAFERLLQNGGCIKAYIAENAYWRDVGTVKNYSRTVYEMMAPMAFKTAFDLEIGHHAIFRRALKGDGSDRRWYRLTGGEPNEGKSLILVDHGIQATPKTGEATAFAAIGRHLRACGVPVPRIYRADTLAGLIFCEDLGDLHLQNLVNTSGPDHRCVAIYRRVIEHWACLAIEGAKGFNPAWAWQSPAYDQDLILEKECRYFVEAFLQGYLGLETAYEELQEDFSRLAEHAMAHAQPGLIHRDLQSRNIMIKDGRPVFIDFQGARPGPLQYDLASLLIDPYVALPEKMQADLLNFAVGILDRKLSIDALQFKTGYEYCALCRNLQMLGAFGFLSQVKGKAGFALYIPQALKTLGQRLDRPPGDQFQRLLACIRKIQNRFSQINPIPHGGR